MKRLLASILILPMLVLPVQAETIKWVDFNVPYESMKYALDQDIATFEQEKHISWIDILALAACRTGGKCALASVKQAVADLKKDKQPEQLLGDLYKYYDYYHRAYTAALGGLVGSYAIEKDGQWVAIWLESVLANRGGVRLQPLRRFRRGPFLWIPAEAFRQRPDGRSGNARRGGGRRRGRGHGLEPVRRLAGGNPQL